jgi:DNA-binding transcriptional regulator YiaG
VGSKFRIRKPIPKKPVSLGEHLKKRRISLRLMQREVAKQMGEKSSTYANWENGFYAPSRTKQSKIIKFLGFNPFENSRDEPPLKDFGDHLKKHRFDLFLSQDMAARHFGVHVTTYRNWEHSHGRPHGHAQRQIIAWIGYDPFARD